MSLRICLKCRTAYAVGLQVCPQCGDPTRNAIYDWEDDVAKATGFGATYYVAEGEDVPGDLPEGVRPVGPGVPVEPPAEPAVPESVAELGALDEVLAAAEPEVVPDPPVSTPPPNSPASSAPDDSDDDGPADYASYPASVLRDLAKERGIAVTGGSGAGYLPKGDLVGRLAAYDTEHGAP